MAKFNKEYIGDINQLFMVKEYTLSGGKKQGVKAIDVSNGTGIDITILPDRGMDIYQLRYKGMSMNYLAKSGIVAPQYYNEQENKWLRSFFVGFLTTCGLDNIGPSVEENGITYGLHGDISNTPAEHVNIIYEEKDGALVVKIRGTLMKASLFGDNYKLTRTFEITYGKQEFYFYDEIENLGYSKIPVMLLYHFNMGYPLLSEEAELFLPTKSVRPRTEHAKQYAAEYLKITSPAKDYEEMCYYHDILADEEGFSTVGIYNPLEKLGLKITYDKNKLDHFIQWKQLGSGQYVMGLEPANATIEGRIDARENGTMKWIEAGEKIIYPMKISLFE